MALHSIKLSLSSGKLSAVLPDGTEIPIIDVDVDDGNDTVKIKLLDGQGNEFLTFNEVFGQFPTVEGDFKQAMKFAFQYVIKDELDAPLGGESDGDTYLVGTGSGDWAGYDGEIAQWDDGASAWKFKALSGGELTLWEDGVEYELKAYLGGGTWKGGGELVLPGNMRIEDKGDHFTDDTVEDALAELAEGANLGQIGKAIWTPADNPTADDSISIGADDYIFKATDNGVLNDPPASPTEAETWLVGFETPTGDWEGHEGEIATCTADDDPGPVAWSFEAPGAGEVFVQIGAALADTLASLVVEINARGTEDVVASEDDTSLTVKTAESVGGVVEAAEIPVVSATEAGDPWVTYAGGKEAGGKMTKGEVALTTANITAPFDIDLTFTPTACSFMVYSATGVPQAVTDMLMTVGANKVTFDPGSDCADTDVLVFMAWN